MPHIDYSTRAGFDSLYRRGGEGKWGHPNTRPEVQIHYCRGLYWPDEAMRWARNYSKLPGLQPTNSVVIVGAGFGMGVEALLQGHTFKGVVYPPFTNVIGLDTSAYIQATKDGNDRAEIEEWFNLVPDLPASRKVELIGEWASDGVRLNGGNGKKARTVILDEDGLSRPSRNRIKKAVGGTVDWAITEMVLTSFSDAEVQNLSTTMHQYATNVAHMYMPLRTEKKQDQRLNHQLVATWQALLPQDHLINWETGGIGV